MERDEAIAQPAGVRTLGVYDIGEELGRGSSGIVVAGHHRGLARDVAIKLLPRLLGIDAETRARFSAEAQLLASFDHPHIVRIYDFVESDGVCALIMERLSGGSVADRLQAGTMSARTACAVILATCSALQYAHGRGVLHRDIKPQNLLLSEEGILKVSDFGIAKVLGRTETVSTRTGGFLGTPAYVAPEHVQGAPPAPSMDVYSTGVLLYLLLCGALPFPPATDPIAEIYQRVHLEPIPLLVRNPQAPAGLADVTARALARDPDARYASGQELALAVSRAAEHEWGPAWAETAEFASAAALHPPNTLRSAAITETLDADAPAPGAQLLERDRELEAISSALDETCAGEGALVYISGHAGTGKTSLSNEALRLARARGMTTLSASGQPRAHATALWLLRELYERALVAEPRGARPPAGDARSAATRIQPEDGPADLPGVPLERAFVALAKSIASRTPLVIVVDDLHVADDGSVDVLLELAACLAGAPVALVLAAMSSVEGEPDELAQRFIGDRFVPHLRLAPLSEEAVGIALGSSERRIAGEFRSACRESTGGNPAAVLDLVEAIEFAGIAPTAANAERVRDIGLQLVAVALAGRLEALSPDAQALGAALAVIGERAPTARVARLAGLADMAARRAAAELARAAILEPDEPLRFASERIRGVAYDGLQAGERSARHLVAARLLHGDGAAADAIGAHLLSTEPRRDTWVLERLQDAATASIDAGCPQAAIAYLGRALLEQPGAQQRHRLLLTLARTHADASDPVAASRVLEDGLALARDRRERIDLLLELGDLRSADEARSAYVDAARLAHEEADAQLMGAVALRFGRGPGAALYAAGVDEALTDVLGQAIGATEGEDGAMRVRLLSRLSVELHPGSHVDRRNVLSREAVELARRLGDPSLQLLADYSRLLALWSPEDLRTRLRDSATLMRRARALDDRALIHPVRNLRLRALLESGAVSQADSEIAASLQAAPGDLPMRRWQTTLHLAMRALDDGRAAEGERLALEAYDIARHAAEPLARRCLDAQIGLHRWLAGDERELIPALRAGHERCPWLPLSTAALIFGLAELNRQTEAIVLLEPLAGNSFDAVPFDGNWLLTTSFVSLACARLGDERRSRLLYETLLPFADRVAVAGDCTIAGPPIACVLGVLATGMCRFDAAEAHFKLARERTLANGSAGQAVFVQHELARMLLTRRHGGDVERALELLGEAVASAAGRGLHRLGARAAALRASAG